MNDTCTYLLELHGQVDLTDLNAMSPLAMDLECADPGVTIARVCTDQSGLLGLMRYLHGLGFVLLSIHRISQEES
jgi:hypothetical protein